MTSGVCVCCMRGGGVGGGVVFKCLYLARNFTKGNNVLSQSTLMDLPIISPVPPLTRETRERQQPTRLHYP